MSSLRIPEFHSGSININRALSQLPSPLQPSFTQLAEAHSMNSEKSAAWYAERRAILRQQLLKIKRLQAEAAGQLMLPIFGDGSIKKGMQADAACYGLKGMRVTK